MSDVKIRDGFLRKMPVLLDSEGQVQYFLSGGDFKLNDLIGREISLSFNGRIECVLCGAVIKKTYADGLCYPCFRDAPENAECIIRPELCRAHEGGGRDPEWERKHHLQPHTVYISYTSGLKVGVTRNDQVPVRWIDQGAVAAIRLAETPNRYLAGCIEVALKEHFADKTAFRKMLTLTEQPDDSLLADAADRAAAFLPEDLGQYVLADRKVTRIHYPQSEIPAKIRSVGLEKNPLITAKLTGIKGQYLFFDDNRVINIRRHSGYFITLSGCL